MPKLTKPLSGSARQRAKGLKPILVWVTAEQHATLKEAAAASGVKAVTGFMLAAALKAAKRK